MKHPVGHHEARPDRRRLAWFARLFLVGVLPSAALALASYEFIVDHFYAKTPYLLDAGWLSAVVHRSGPLLRNPAAMSHYGKSFYEVHFSPFMSVFSMASYLVPLDRIEWYAFFQAVVYAPLGFATYLVGGSTRADAAPLWKSLPLSMLSMLAALAFAFSAQILVAMEFPHFELAISGFLCLLLAAVATERRRLVWLLLVLTVSVREDAGFHAAIALCPLLYISWRDGGAREARRLLVRLIAAAGGAGVVAFAVKALFFPSSIVRESFFGDPTFHHLSAHALGERLAWLVVGCPFISVPVLGTIVIAGATRDARYLFGWLAATPWLVVNLLAVEEPKWRITAYIGFPLVPSLFWVLLYGARLAPASSRLRGARLEAAFAATCLASIGALYLARPWLVMQDVRGALRLDAAHPREVRAYARTLSINRAALGRLTVDPTVAAVAIEPLTRADGYDYAKPTDTYAFHRDGPLDANLLTDLALNGIHRCAHVRETGYVICSRFEEAARGLTATDELPTVLVYAGFDLFGRRLTFGKAGVVIAAGSAPGLTIATRNLAISKAGSYEFAWEFQVDGGSDDAADAAGPDAGGAVTVDLVIDGKPQAKASVSRGLRGQQRLSLPFTIATNQPFGTRLWYRGPASVTIVTVQLRAAGAP